MAGVGARPRVASQAVTVSHTLTVTLGESNSSDKYAYSNLAHHRSESCKEQLMWVVLDSDGVPAFRHRFEWIDVHGVDKERVRV